MAAYYVTLRAFERRFIQGAIDEGGNGLDGALSILQVSSTFLKHRVNYLGGLLDEPLHEPPVTAERAYREVLQENKVEESLRTPPTPSKPRGRPKKIQVVDNTSTNGHTSDEDQLELPGTEELD